MHSDAHGNDGSGDQLEGGGVEDKEHSGGIFRVFGFIQKLGGFDAVGGSSARDSQKIDGEIHTNGVESLRIVGFEEFTSDGF